MWFKWQLMRLGLAWQSLIGGLKRRAIDDVNNCPNESLIKEGQALDYEREIAEKFYDFWDADFSNFKRMSLYFFIIVSAIGLVLWRYLSAEHVVVQEDYLLMSAAGVAVLLAVLFLYELLFNSMNEELVVTKDEFDSAETWMHYISEKSRKTMPVWAILIVGIGLLIEAAAISIIAASYVSDISKNESMWVGSILGLIVAFALGFVIHKAGESMYQNHQRVRLHRVIQREGGHKESETLQALQKDHRDFDTQEEGFLRRYGMQIIAVVFVTALAVAAFEQRAELNLDMIQAQQTEVADDLLLSADDALMPASVKKVEREIVEEKVSQEASHAEKGMYASLIMLTVVFLIINLLGVLFGYLYSFYHERSKACYKII
ncbi:MAG: hypothetical protein Q9N02_00910, partial [Ghiorsea sp.]|nr:hypothetical protein [Ghiorsea sp.]